MSKYRKKPVVVEAVQLLWSTWSEMCEHAKVGKLHEGSPEGCYVDVDGSVCVTDPGPAPDGAPSRIGLRIPTPEGIMLGVEGDWIIRGTRGELYPCKPDVFSDVYEPAE